MVTDRKHGVRDLNHVGTTLSRRESQQGTDLGSVHAALVLERLLLEHSISIGQDSELVGRVGLEPTTTRL